MPIKNYTTVIPALRTISEIQEMLAAAGARRIGLDYDQSGQPAAIMFQIAVGEHTLSYRLPCRHEPIYKMLLADKKALEVLRSKRIKLTPQHARNVAWRITRDWLDAQLALIQTEMADLEEIMLPYMLTGEGRTVYQVMQSSAYLLPKKD